ncbi:MAG: ribbon-helix-helix protein, CopG family [Nostocales cyanobacterium]|nr:MAG: ribbon-helix-helix protein, CopG family [Nostocales cyanobacterium]
MNNKITVITFRLPLSEKKKLEKYCLTSGRSQTDVLREFIRSLNEDNNI